MLEYRYIGDGDVLFFNQTYVRVSGADNGVFYRLCLFWRRHCLAYAGDLRWFSGENTAVRKFSVRTVAVSRESEPMVVPRLQKAMSSWGLVSITTYAVNTRGYSDKPIDTLMALANDSTITGRNGRSSRTDYADRYHIAAPMRQYAQTGLRRISGQTLYRQTDTIRKACWRSATIRRQERTMALRRGRNAPQPDRYPFGMSLPCPMDLFSCYLEETTCAPDWNTTIFWIIRSAYICMVLPMRWCANKLLAMHLRVNRRNAALPLERQRLRSSLAIFQGATAFFPIPAHSTCKATASAICVS